MLYYIALYYKYCAILYPGGIDEASPVLSLANAQVPEDPPARSSTKQQNQQTRITSQTSNTRKHT